MAWLIAAVLALPFAAHAQTTLATYAVVGDGIPESLTGTPGDAPRGRALVLDRASTCILCHSGPFPETRFQGDLDPPESARGLRNVIAGLSLTDTGRLIGYDGADLPW